VQYLADFVAAYNVTLWFSELDLLDSSSSFRFHRGGDIIDNMSGERKLVIGLAVAVVNLFLLLRSWWLKTWSRIRYDTLVSRASCSNAWYCWLKLWNCRFVMDRYSVQYWHALFFALCMSLDNGKNANTELSGKWGERRVAFFASIRDFKFWVWNAGNVVLLSPFLPCRACVRLRTYGYFGSCVSESFWSSSFHPLARSS
jgi:hypothetical protein